MFYKCKSGFGNLTFEKILDDAYKYFDKSFEFPNSGLCTVASNLCDLILSVYPPLEISSFRYEVIYLQGHIYLRQKLFEKSSTFFSEIIDNTNPIFNEYINLGNSTNRFNRTEYKVLEFLQGSYYSRGLCMLDLQKYNEAVDNFNKALDPEIKFLALDSDFQIDDYLIFLNKGIAYKSINFEKAKKYLDLVIDLKQVSLVKKVSAYYQRGELFRSVGQTEAAVKDYEIAEFSSSYYSPPELYDFNKPPVMDLFLQEINIKTRMALSEITQQKKTNLKNPAT